MHENVPVRFGRGRLDSLGNKGLAAYIIAKSFVENAEYLPRRPQQGKLVEWVILDFF